MESAHISSRPIESEFIIDILYRTGILKVLIKHREFRSIHELLDRLFEMGIIDTNKYDDLMDQLVELTNLDGKEFREKAKKLEQMIISAIDVSIPLKNRILMSLHKSLDRLFEMGIIDTNKYDDLMDQLVELTNLDGKEFREKAKKLEQILRGLRNEPT